MELENEKLIVVDNAEQFFFNTKLEENANTKFSFSENDTNFNQSMDTNTVSVKEEIADSVFVEEDSCLETKIKIENHDFYHSATHLFNKKFYYNENNIQNDLDTTSNSVKVSLNNAVGESDLREILKEEKCVVERCTQKKTITELLGAPELSVHLQQQDVYELQKTFKGNQSESNDSEMGIWGQWNSVGRLKRFWCSCLLKFDTRFQLLLHINENHKEEAKAKNIIETQYMVPGSSPGEILFKCNECSYVSNRKDAFKRHLLRHKSLDELEETFRCASCPFVTKRKINIASHMLVHFPPERQSIHKCPHCDFQAKQKRYIKYHLKRIHDLEKAAPKKLIKRPKRIYKKPDRFIMYKCEVCPYSTKYKHNFTQHRMVHVKVSEEDRVPCSLCPFKAKNRNSLRSHMRTHLDPSQLTMYRCDQCPYQSRTKSLLNQHSLKHKKKEELFTFQCKLCDCQTNRDIYFQSHCKRMHTDPSEVDWKSCDECEFETKTSTGLESDSAITHKEPEELEIFQSSQSSFSTKMEIKSEDMHGEIEEFELKLSDVNF